MTNSEPTYVKNLRAHQKLLVRDLIMQALAAIISQGRIHTFTLAEIAARAGVSYNTIHRYFATREFLLEQFALWGPEVLAAGRLPLPSSLDALPDYVQQQVSFYEQNAVVVNALAIVFEGAPTLPPAQGAADHHMRAQVAERSPYLSAAEHRQFAAVLRLLSGAQAWRTLRRRFGVDPDQTGTALRRALEAVLRDLDERNAEASRDGGTISVRVDGRTELP